MLEVVLIYFYKPDNTLEEGGKPRSRNRFGVAVVLGVLVYFQYWYMYCVCVVKNNRVLSNDADRKSNRVMVVSEQIKEY